MKKIYLFAAAALLLSVMPSFGQFEQGKIMTGVTSTLGLGDFGTDLLSTGFTREKYKNEDGDIDKGDTGFGFNLLPRAGYFVIDNLAVGLDLIIGYQSSKDPDDGDKYSSTTLAIGPFARYYYPLEKCYPFVEANLGFGTWREKGEEWDDKEGMFLYGVGIGAAKPLGENVMIDGSFGYSSVSWKDEDNDKYIYGSVGLRVGFTMFFGLKE